MPNQYRTNLDYAIEIIAFILIIGGIALGIQLNHWFFLVTALTLVFILFYQNRRRKRLIKLQKELIKNQWGKGPKVKAGFECRDYLHSFLLQDKESDFIIDNITWQDLNMDEVFLKIDHTMSLPGMQYLYYILRRPIFQRDALAERKKTQSIP